MRVLLLDDDALLAVDLAEQLLAAGYEVLGPAGSVATARALLQEGCDCAVIDVNLGAETSEPIVELLRTASKPFFVLTGYTQESVSPAYTGGIVFTKPLRFAELDIALRKCAERLGLRRDGDDISGAD
jgi:DNA-binding response OmpR family regulator